MATWRELRAQRLLKEKVKAQQAEIEAIKASAPIKKIKLPEKNGVNIVDIEQKTERIVSLLEIIEKTLKQVKKHLLEIRGI